MKKILALLIGFYACDVFAIQPEDGWWWNASEPGRGLNIETQNGLMFLSAFTYAQNGSQSWYTAIGNYNYQTNTFNSGFSDFTGGQCLGCTYRAPTAGPGFGQMRIVFDSPSAGTLFFNGGQTRISRYYYGYPSVIAPEFLLGAWSFTDVLFTLVDAQWISLSRVSTGSNGPFAAGARYNAADAPVVGSYSSELNKFTVLVDSSTSFYKFYSFTLGKNSGEGRAWLFRKTDTLSGNGNLMHAIRMASQAELSSNPGLVIAQDESKDFMYEKIYRKSKKSAPEYEKNEFEKLKSIMESINH